MDLIFKKFCRGLGANRAKNGYIVSWYQNIIIVDTVEKGLIGVYFGKKTYKKEYSGVGCFVGNDDNYRKILNLAGGSGLRKADEGLTILPFNGISKEEENSIMNIIESFKVLKSDEIRAEFSSVCENSF